MRANFRLDIEILTDILARAQFPLREYEKNKVFITVVISYIKRLQRNMKKINSPRVFLL